MIRRWKKMDGAHLRRVKALYTLQVVRKKAAAVKNRSEGKVAASAACPDFETVLSRTLFQMFGSRSFALP